MKKRVLVCGGAGFLGSHLCEALLARGHHVLCLDDFSTGRRSNVAHLMSMPRFSLIEHDIVEPVRIATDEIYNLACPASPPHYQRDPIRTVKISVIGSMNLLDLAARLRIPIFQASTSEVYGDPELHPQNEQYRGSVSTIGPRACYDEGKRCAETLFFDYQRKHQVNVRVARIFNTFGPRMQPDDGRVISNFIVQALQNLPITLYGDGSQTRSFCYVTDLISGFIRMMEHPGPLPGPINLGNPAERTVRSTAESIIAMTGSSSILVTRPLPEDDPKRRCPDIRQAMDLLTWCPNTSFENGLKQTVKYFQAEIGAGEYGGHTKIPA